jgi:tRNA U34 5-carboxymethylaminomethyl modifying enzyme MnmG/GidA
MKNSNQFSNLLASEKEAIEKGIEKRICPRIEDKIQQLMNEFAHTVNY